MFGKNGRRNRYDIIADILRITVYYNQRDEISRRCNLDHNQIKRYADLAIEHKMLEQLTDNTYQITDKGLRYIEVYEALVDNHKLFIKRLQQYYDALAGKFPEREDISNEGKLVQ